MDKAKKSSDMTMDVLDFLMNEGFKEKKPVGPKKPKLPGGEESMVGEPLARPEDEEDIVSTLQPRY